MSSSSLTRSARVCLHFQHGRYASSKAATGVIQHGTQSPSAVSAPSDEDNPEFEERIMIYEKQSMIAKMHNKGLIGDKKIDLRSQATEVFGASIPSLAERFWD